MGIPEEQKLQNDVDQKQNPVATHIGQPYYGLEFVDVTNPCRPLRLQLLLQVYQTVRFGIETLNRAKEFGVVLRFVGTRRNLIKHFVNTTGKQYRQQKIYQHRAGQSYQPHHHRDHRHQQEAKDCDNGDDRRHARQQQDPSTSGEP